jgi:hypothetical protein
LLDTIEINGRSVMEAEGVGVKRQDVIAALDQAVASGSRSNAGRGAVFSLAEGTSAMAILRHAWTVRHRDEDVDDFSDLDSGSWIDSLCEVIGADPSWVVSCWNPSSMASGIWGLGTFECDERGYIYSFPDARYGEFEDENPLYGAWEPANSPDAARECFIRVYRDVWDNIGLPPSFGEAANGPLGWMTDAILGFEGPLSVYVAAPSDHLLECMLGTASPESVAAELNIPVGVVTSLLSDLREHGVPEEAELTGDRRRAFLALSLEAVNWR